MSVALLCTFAMTSLTDHVKPSRSSSELVNLPLVMQQQRSAELVTFTYSKLVPKLFAPVRAVMQADAACAAAQKDNSESDQQFKSAFGDADMRRAAGRIFDVEL